MNSYENDDTTTGTKVYHHKDVVNVAYDDHNYFYNGNPFMALVLENYKDWQEVLHDRKEEINVTNSYYDIAFAFQNVIET